MVIGVAASVAYLAVFLLVLALLGRMVIEWIRSYAPAFRPHGATLLAVEGIMTVTDPPVRGLRRLIPPMRLGAVALDLSVMLLLVIGWLLLRVLAPYVL